ncbi:helix-turn-helix domain-containing protein [Nocardia aurantiaca]|uniref:Helix-turn-helix domain-containing protein n=1 Tax=Nocardia aurantiaca TaxID=2675850 RepID=A0A6I3KLY7_9NOCA|nr:helix-turn-helix domain-containing protein [Nocardia aurantiaca]MTE11603.1 helix-turn-helix domain-containing protein [Nocardia aurantiaca]
MRGGVEPAVMEVRSTPEVSQQETFAEWEAVVAAAYVPVVVTPVRSGEFRARIVQSRFGTIDVSMVTASGQHLSRIPRLINEPEEPILFAIVTTHGHGWLEQDGRVGELADGGLTLHVSSRPFSVHFEQSWGVVAVQVPLSEVVGQSGVPADRLPTAVRFPPEGAAGLVGRFFCGLAQLQYTAPDQAATLAKHGTGLLASVVQLAADDLPRDEPAQALAKQRALAFIQRHYADPELTIDQVAGACAVSRRTLYRLFEHGEDGVATMVRRMRIERALALIRTDPSRPLLSVAGASGFVSERQFYRAFKREMGMTPGEFRSHHA